MNRLQLKGPLPLTAVVVALCFVGCSDEGSDTDDPADVGVVDLGTTDDDGGGGIFVPDAGFVDSGPPDSGILPCPEGTEGCACNWVPGPDLVQNDCDQGLICVPWDTVFADNRLVGPVQSCVRPCATDSDCGTNADGSQRVCRESGFTPESGIEFICYDEESGVDQFCGYTKLTPSQIPGLPLETAGRMVACPNGVPCEPFNDLHIDEGLCLEICAESDDCPEERPFCNSGLFTTNSTVTPTVGACSAARLGPGDLCGSDNLDELGLTTQCDTSSTAVPNTQCLPGFVVGLDPLADGFGICTTLCTATVPCESEDPVLGPTTCSTPYVPLVDGSSAGVCGTGCTAFPNTCTGDGKLGAGRFCAGGFDESSFFCMDIVPPTLAPATLEGGLLDPNSGEDCLTANTTNILSCPAGTVCASAQGTARGFCIYGCSTAAGADPDLCSRVLGTDTTTVSAFCAQNVEETGFCSLP